MSCLAPPLRSRIWRGTLRCQASACDPPDYDWLEQVGPRGLAASPSMAYSQAVWFVETSVFSGQLFEHLHDDDYRSLQLALTLRPEQGALIPGSGGLRKLRWALRGKGKRGGLRVIYYWDSAEEVIYLIYLYSKNELANLRPDQLKLLRRTIEEDLK
jgi:mRNA-degrading endonuclease RelE of RelBE toxin-antitoxin system